MAACEETNVSKTLVSWDDEGKCTSIFINRLELKIKKPPRHVGWLVGASGGPYPGRVRETST